MQYSLTSIEKNFLYKKYTNLGLNPKEAYEQVKKLVNHLKLLVDKLKSQKKDKTEIDKKFKEEFNKICYELESKF